MKSRQDFDNVVWDKNDGTFEDAQKQLRLKSTCRLVESLVEEVFKTPSSLRPPIFFGGFNVIYQVRPEGHSSNVIVRVPCPSLVQFPEEKTACEAATMRFLSQNTIIQIPTVFDVASSTDIGPALIVQYIENARDMSDALEIPNQPLDDTPALNPTIEEDTLKSLYKKMAVLLMRLVKPDFPRIGSLVKLEDDTYSVVGRPITLNMNNMIQLANIPRSVLPPKDQTWGTADSWYTAMVQMHMTQLVFQHKDLVRSEDDCRNKSCGTLFIPYACETRSAFYLWV
ncbi:hypothetical protein ACHAPU_000809 [Fusarium lateritium]